MSQQAIAQDRIRDLSIPSNQQPGRLASRRPVGIEAGLTAIVLAALCLSLTLCYAVGTAMCTRNAYSALALKRDIEDLRAQNELLRYQINLSQSSYRVDEVAKRLGMTSADAVKDVDYVVLPHSNLNRVELAELDPAKTRHGFTGVLTAFTEEVAGGAAGRAEASTSASHRQ